MNAPLRHLPLVVERLPSRSGSAGPAALPEPALAALAAIVRDMRDVPRDCLRDPAELFIWLRRMAGRVESVATMPAPTPPRSARRAQAPAAAPARALTARQQAEAVFGNSPKVEKPRALRSITDPKGRRVRVEFRKAETNGQTRLEF